MRARIVTGTVPSSTGTVDYTHSDITSWSTKGFAIVLVSGQSDAETAGGRISLGICDHTGTQLVTSTRLLEGRTNVSDCCVANHNDRLVRLTDAAPQPGPAMWVRGDFSSALSNGIRINWSDVNGVAVAGHTFNVVVVLVDGLTGAEVGTGSGAALSPAFEPDAIFAYGFSGSIQAAVNLDGHVCIGGARDGSPIKQASAVAAWDSAADNQSAGAALDTVYAIDLNLPSTITSQAATDFHANGFDDTGAGGAMWAAFLPDNAEPIGVALEVLSSGSTGAQSFTGLGISSQVIVGLINGNTVSGSAETNTDALSALCVFVTDGTNTYSLSLAQTREAIGGGNNSDAFSRYTSGSINMLSHTGGTAFAATVTGVSGGLDLNISTGMTGRMVLFGFGQGNLISVQNETVQISETSVLLQQLVLVVNETIEISEGAGPVLVEQDAQTEPDQKIGKTYQGGARYGGTVQGGGAFGETAS